MPKSFTRFTLRGMAVALLLTLTLVPYFSSSAANTTSSLNGIVFNEILPDPNGGFNYDTDGDGNAETQDEFVEIFNISGAAVDISGWQLWDPGADLWFTFPGSTVLGAGNYAVVVGDIVGGSLPTVDAGNLAFSAGGASGLNNGGDNVVLYDPNTDSYIHFTFNGAAIDVPTNEQDLDYAGFSPTATLVGSVEDWGFDTDGVSLVREPAGDTNVVQHNTISDDLASPGNATPPPVPVGACGDSATLISAVQGNGFSSPISGDKVDIEGIVVGDFQLNSELSGFYLQEEDADWDGDPLTSEGIFVAAGTDLIDVTVNSIVRVRGTVTEAFGETRLSGSDAVDCLSSGTPTAPSINLPLVSIDDLEPYEGMLITFPQELFVTETFALGEFGEISLSVGGRLFNPTEVVAPGTQAYTDLVDLNNRSRILVDDGSNDRYVDPIPYLSSTSPETIRIGDSTTNLTGALGYGFSNYRLNPTATINWATTNDRANVTLPVDPTLRVASFNVLNYFTTLGDRGADNANEFARQQEKIVDALANIDADVFGLMEIENNDDVAVAALVDALNAVVGAGTYAYIPTGITGDNDGGVEGADAITVAVIYKSASVTPIGTTGILETGTFDGLSRPPVAQAFQTTSGGEFIVVINHFKSKGCSGASGNDNDLSDGQGCYNETRTNSAIDLHNWLGTDPTGTGSQNVLIIGDLNAYSQEDPILELEKNYTNLVKSFVSADQRYSYVFFGESGVLDHALASTGFAGAVENTVIYHINADEPRALDYNDDVEDFNGEDLNADLSVYAPDQWRSSDHDAVVVDLSEIGVTGDIVSTDTIQPGEDVTVTVTDADANNDDAVVDSVDVAVTSDNGESETVTLAETGLATGVFSGVISTTASTPTASNDVVEAENGDTLTFTYTDPANSAGQSEDIASTTAVVFDAFVLVSPADDAFFRSGTEITEITWEHLVSADSYQLQVFNISTNASGVSRLGLLLNETLGTDICDAGLCTYTVAPLIQEALTTGQYSWTVFADTLGGTFEAVNAPYSFTVNLEGIELVVNGGFEDGRNNWNARNLSRDKVKCNKPDKNKYFTPFGECAFMFKGSDTENSRLIQKPDDSVLRDGDTLDFSAQVDPRSATPGARIAKLIVKYTDGSKTRINLFVPDASTLRGVEDYVLVSDSTTLDLSTLEIAKFKVIVGWRGKTGKFFIDNVSVIASQVVTLADTDAREALPLPQAPDGSDFRRGN